MAEQTLDCGAVVDGNDVTICSGALSAANHRYVRLREQSGTPYFESSPDGSSWTVEGTTPEPFDVGLVSQGVHFGRTTDTPTAQVGIGVDDFNVAP